MLPEADVPGLIKYLTLQNKSLMPKGKQLPSLQIFNLVLGLTASTTWTTTTAATTAASAGWPRRRKTAAPAAPTAAKIRPWPTTRRTNFDPEKKLIFATQKKIILIFSQSAKLPNRCSDSASDESLQNKSSKNRQCGFFNFCKRWHYYFFLILANAAAAFESSLDRRSSMKPMMIFAFLEILFFTQKCFYEKSSFALKQQQL